MSWVAVGIAGASVIGAGINANSASRAGRAAQRGADAATAEEARQYDQTRRDFAPYRNAGIGALNLLGQPYGLSTGTNGINGYYGDEGDLIGDAGGVPTVNTERYAADPAYRYAWDKTLEWEKANRPGWNGQQTYWARATGEDVSRLNESLARNIADYRAQNPTQQPGTGGQGNFNAFMASPDYNFRRTEGMRGLEQTAAARGGAFSGNALRALSEYNSNLASTEYGNYFNRLASIAGIGQSATQSTAQAGAQYGAAAGRNALYAGDARASGIINQGNAISGGISDLAGAYGYYKRGGFGGGGNLMRQGDYYYNM